LYIQKKPEPIKNSCQDSIQKIDFSLFRLDHLNQEEIVKMKGFLKIFNIKKETIKITKYNTQLPNLFKYPQVPENQVQEMLNRGFIRDNSTNNSPTWVVPKKLMLLVNSKL